MSKTGLTIFAAFAVKRIVEDVDLRRTFPAPFWKEGSEEGEEEDEEEEEEERI